MENLGILTKEDVEARFLLLKILSLQEKIFFGPIKIFNFKKVISLIRLLMHLRKYLNKPEWSLRETFEQYRHDNIFEQHHWFW
jgi:hypothetical protein